MGFWTKSQLIFNALRDQAKASIRQGVRQDAHHQMALTPMWVEANMPRPFIARLVLRRNLLGKGVAGIDALAHKGRPYKCAVAKQRLAAKLAPGVMVGMAPELSVRWMCCNLMDML